MACDRIMMPFLLSAAMLMMAPTLALAEDSYTPAIPSSTATVYDVSTSPASTPASTSKKWDVTVGAGAAVRPTYEGSDKYTVSPVPLINATYDDMLSLSPRGINLYDHAGSFRFGAGLTYSGGRKDSRSNGIFSEGDNRLNGLGNIDSALGLKAFASYDFGLVNVTGAVTKFTGDQNDGTLVDIGASVPYKMNSQLTLTPHIGATWADQNYMQTFFGVTATQAADSRFSRFDAGAGIKDVGAGVNANYRLNQHWFIDASADVKELTGDAADSPITFSSTESTFATVIGYHF